MAGTGAGAGAGTGTGDRRKEGEGAPVTKTHIVGYSPKDVNCQSEIRRETRAFLHDCLHAGGMLTMQALPSLTFHDPLKLFYEVY